MMARKPTLAPDLDLPDDLPRARPGGAEPPAPFHEAPPPAPPAVGGVKERTVATTLYLLPHDHVRLRTMAIRRNISFQTLVLDALDELLKLQGEPPVTRWDTRRRPRRDGWRT